MRCLTISSQGVPAVKRIHIRRNNELVPTNTFILTFCKPLLPDTIKAGYLKIPVVPFISNLLRCFKCHRYGHGGNACRGKVTCARCGKVDIHQYHFLYQLQGQPLCLLQRVSKVETRKTGTTS